MIRVDGIIHFLGFKVPIEHHAIDGINQETVQFLLFFQFFFMLFDFSDIRCDRDKATVFHFRI